MADTRRHFLKTTATAGLALSTAAAQSRTSPNDRIQIATIGIGGMGTGDTRSALTIPGVELVAACDLYQGRLVRVKEVFGHQLFTTNDYREILARKDIDAVIIGTTDHWHAPISIAEIG